MCAAGRIQFMDEGFSGVARTWSDGASGGDLVQFFLYLGLDVSALDPADRLEAFEDVMATHPNLVEYGLRGFLGEKPCPCGRQRRTVAPLCASGLIFLLLLGLRGVSITVNIGAAAIHPHAS